MDDDGRLLISPALVAARGEYARRDFAYFVRLVRPEYDVQWFHDLMISELELAGTADHDTRLGLSLPPGHAKTEYALLFMAWMFVRDTAIQIKYVTYSTTVAKSQFRRFKYILSDPLLVAYFGEQMRSIYSIKTDKVRNSIKIENLYGPGFIDVTGFGGEITSSRCDLVVIDDPLKGPAQANSLAIRNGRWEDYTSAIKTRRRVNRPLRILMLFTRWHVDDLTGRCKRHEPDAWRWVELECLRDQIDHPADPREPGEALWPAVITQAQAESERLVSPEVFIALFQQRPMPASGRVFLKRWFPSYSVLLAKRGKWYQSWDFRHGGKKNAGSYCVAILAYKPDDEERVYLIDVIRGRWDPAESHEEFRRRQRKTEQATSGTASHWGRAPMIVLVENKADGVGILSLNAGKVSGMIPIMPRVDKETRARAVAPFARAGQVVLPTQARWLADFLEEVTNFPAANSDDQVDALSQLLDYIWGATDTAQTSAAVNSTWEALMG